MGNQSGRGETEVNAKIAVPEGDGVPRITAVSGPGAGRSLAMARALATAGRHATNDLVLADPRVSGVHLELSRVGSRVHVRDAGSTNGTWLGLHRVTEIELVAGGELTVGDTVIRVDTDGGARPVARSLHESFGELVGESPAMREVFATLERIAPKNLPVLIHGETGSGRKEVARAIHARSARAGGPFVVVDAASLPDAMAATLFFGSEAAGGARAGYFESASGGTLFIDEIGALSPALQTQLLAVVEHREITRVGGASPVRVDVRLVAATRRDLRHELDAGRFREDLFMRLAQTPVLLPPLRDRLVDIPVLCRKLLTSIAGDRSVLIEASALAHLQAQPWPGNVRELSNVLVRAAALATDDVIRRGDVSGEGVGFRGSREERKVMDLNGEFAPAKERAIDRFESVYLAALMRRCAGNLSRAAREANLARHHLRDLLKKRGLYGASWDAKDEEG